MSHFSQANPKGQSQHDVPALLRRVADSIAALGRVHVHDVTFHDELDGDGEPWPTMTVYFSREAESAT